MPDITPDNYIDINTELANLSLYKYHPNGILNVSLNRLSDMLNGKVTIVDPSNPFTYLLETSALNTAFAIQEYTLLVRKRYPRLANTEADLFNHMSDFDYLGIYSEPAYGKVHFNLLFNDFVVNAYYDNIQGERILKIPRHFKLTIDKYIFTLPSAIIIRQTDNGVIDVKYENQTFNNIFPITTNYINFGTYSLNQDEKYITFTVDIPEVDIENTSIPVSKSQLFKKTLTFKSDRKFYYLRAFHKVNDVWTEMLVTHTDEVYDILKPTCVATVSQSTNEVTCFIPPVYINTDLVTGSVMLLIYTTNGAINVNFKDYSLTNFVTEYSAIFPELEEDVYTEPLSLVSKTVYIEESINAGKDGLSFETIKASVIDNSIGDRVLPITAKQANFSVGQDNFKLITDVDVVTDRIFLLEAAIPKATTRYPMTRINLDIIEYKTTISDLRAHGNLISVVDDNNTIIPEGVVFKLDESDGLTILTEQELSSLNSLSDITLTTELNGTDYMSTMYHYILDTSDQETELRPYEVSKPSIEQINFKEFNSTARIGVNSVSSSTVIKTDSGYRILVMANLKKYVDNITQLNITPYFVYTDVNGSKFYLEGTYYTTLNGFPVYQFNVVTDFYINKDNKINFINFKDSNNTIANIYVDINSTLELIYVSNIIPANYVQSTMDDLIAGSYLGIGRCVVTLEDFTFTFAKYLERLYSRVHTSVGDSVYQTYLQDVPLRYTSNVYNSANQIVHHVNDIVLDGDGNPVVQHHAGDVMLDTNGDPIEVEVTELNRYLNLALMDYRAVIATSSDTANYRNYVKSYVTDAVVNKAVSVQAELLDNTEAFVTVPRNINYANVLVGNKTKTIKCQQSFELSVLVTNAVYNDTTIRDSIEYTIISEIDDYLSANTIYSKTELLNIIYNKIKEYVKTVSFSMFTELDEEYIEMSDTHNRLSLNKKLMIESDGSYNLEEDVVIKFNK